MSNEGNVHFHTDERGLSGGSQVDRACRETHLAPGPLVEVTWSDSAGHSDWHQPEDARRSLDETACITAGYMAEDDERGVLLVMGAGAMGTWLNSMAIPRHAIVNVRRFAERKP